MTDESIDEPIEQVIARLVARAGMGAEPMTEECRACEQIRVVCLVCGLCEDCHDHAMVVESALHRDARP